MKRNRLRKAPNKRSSSTRLSEPPTSDVQGLALQEIRQSILHALGDVRASLDEKTPLSPQARQLLSKLKNAMRERPTSEDGSGTQPRR